MNKAQTYSDTLSGQFNQSEQPKTSSISMAAVVLIFISIFLIILIAIGAFFYFLVRDELKNISLETQPGTKLTEINQNAAQEEQLIENKNQYYRDIKEAGDLWAAGRYQEARQKASDALVNASTSEDKAVAHYWIGLVNYKEQNLEAAESEMKLALELFPNYAPPYVTLAAVEMDRGNFQQALEYSEKCLNLDSSYAWCHNDYGLSLLYLGRKEEGIKSLEKAVSLAPDSYVFRDNLTRARQTE